MPNEQESLHDFSFDNESNMSPDGTNAQEILNEVKNFSIQPTSSTDKQKAEDQDGQESDHDFGDLTGTTEKVVPKKKETTKRDVQKLTEQITDEDEDEDDDKDEDEVDKKPKPAKAKQQAAATEEEEEDEDQDDDNDTDANEPDEKELRIFTAMGKEFVNRGFFNNVTIKKKDQLSEKKFFDLVEEEMEARLVEKADAMAKNISEDGKAYLRHLAAGGTTSGFLNVYGKSFSIKDFDENNEDHQKKVATHYLRTVEKLDGEDLQERIEFLEQKGRLKEFAKKQYTAIQQADAANKEAVTEKIKQDKAKAAEAAEAFATNIHSTLKKTKEFGSFTLTPKDKKELPDFILKPTVKSGDKAIPELYAEIGRILRGTTEEDRKDLIILSKVIKAKFNFDEAGIEIKSKEIRKIRKGLSGELGDIFSSVRKKKKNGQVSLAEAF